MRGFILGLVGLIIISNCSFNRVRTEKIIDEETGIGYVFERELNNEREVGKFRIYFVCGDEDRKVLVRNRNYSLDNSKKIGFYRGTKVPIHSRQKHFNTESDTDNLYEDCVKLYGTSKK